MTKCEFLESLSFRRKAELYIEYLEINKYFDDLKPFYKLGVKNVFNKNDFDSYMIANMIDRHSSCLTAEEWEVYKDLEDY